MDFFKKLAVVSGLISLLIVGCSNESSSSKKNVGAPVGNALCKVSGKNDIVILFTNDVHCGVDEKIGYAGLAAYRDSLKTITPNVLLADMGDAVQGNFWGTLSRGGFIVKLMNKVGYDVAVFGNHEFDYGMERLARLVDSSRTNYVVSNFSYIGKKENLFAKLSAYKVVEKPVVGRNIKVGFVGAVTPESYVSSTPKYFEEDGVLAYDLYEGDKRLVEVLQKNIDLAKKEGADYVVLLAHLGVANASAPYRSIDIIHGLTGVDVVLDGHSHSVIPQDTVRDANGKVVLLASTGSKLENIGQLVIAENGSVCTKLVHDYSSKNAEVAASVDSLKVEFDKLLNRVVAQSPASIEAVDANAVRLSRVAENGIGNLMADALRHFMKSDVAFVNGGNVRANIPKGDVTYGNILNISPFGNKVVSSKVKGSALRDALEYSYRQMQTGRGRKQVVSNEVETGSFLQLSGIKVVVDGKTKSGVLRDSLGMFAGIDGKRKVLEVLIEKDGRYVPLDTAAEYLVASLDYLLENRGDGYSMFDESVVVRRSGLTDAEVMVDYLQNVLAGKIPERYAKPEGRIRLQ